MRKVILLLTLLSVFVIGRYSSWLPLRANAQQKDKDDCPCADVNGDANVDLSDAVYLLNWLFLGGPEANCPPCVDPPTPTCALPASGQTLCYDTWGVIDCSDPNFPGQDGFYQLGCGGPDRHVDNGDGTVTDNCTGLIWQKVPDPTRRNWQQALQYCEDLPLAGHEDWRLPNVKELFSLTDNGRFAPALDPIFSAPWQSGEDLWYWTSTSNMDRPAEARHIRFYYGSVRWGTKTWTLGVRAVRGPVEGEDD